MLNILITDKATKQDFMYDAVLRMDHAGDSKSFQELKTKIPAKTDQIDLRLGLNELITMTPDNHGASNDFKTSLVSTINQIRENNPKADIKIHGLEYNPKEGTKAEFAEANRIIRVAVKEVSEQSSGDAIISYKGPEIISNPMEKETKPKAIVKASNPLIPELTVLPAGARPKPTPNGYDYSQTFATPVFADPVNKETPPKTTPIKHTAIDPYGWRANAHGIGHKAPSSNIASSQAQQHEHHGFPENVADAAKAVGRTLGKVFGGHKTQTAEANVEVVTNHTSHPVKPHEDITTKKPDHRTDLARN